MSVQPHLTASWLCPRSHEQRAEPATDAASPGLFRFGGCQASWLELLYNWPECCDLVHGCEDDLIPLLLKAAVLVKARPLFPSDGPFSHLIHNWSEWGSFFAHDRSGYISSPVAFQSSHKPCSLTAVTYYPNRIYVTLWGADSRREKRGDESGFGWEVWETNASKWFWDSSSLSNRLSMCVVTEMVIKHIQQNSLAIIFL